MLLIMLAAVMAGGFAGSITLWVTGYGGDNGETAARLGKLRSENPLDEPASSQFSLRRRGGVSFGGISLVSTKLATQWARQLDRAGLSLNVKEFFTLRVAIGLGGAMMAMLFIPAPQLRLVGALGAFGLGYLFVGMFLKRKIAKRRQKMESQLVELLQMLSSGLRAGFGLIQALDGAQEQLQPPLQTEMRRTLRDISVGSSMETALQALNDRVGSSDFDIVITAIMIQRSVGGNLAEILDNVAHTMRERERIRGEIRTLTSQQRLTGYVIGALPVGLFIIFQLISPEFTSLLYTTSVGRMMLGYAVFSEAMGFFVIKKIVDIEV
jgi:tight adherence protein B